MNQQTYFRPASEHQTEIVIVNSRFITHIAPAAHVDDAKAFIQRIRETMPDANHHVYAFRVGYGNSVIEGMSDDGEPSGTSGPPTLAVLRGSDIGDIVLVTTRYFGGTKLGTGGLVRAYSDAARTALDSLPTELKTPKTQLGMDISYSLLEPVRRLIDEHHGRLDDEIFAGDVTLLVTFVNDDVQPFTTALRDLSAGQVEPIIMAELD